uniref:Uncharacterized protein n=1 Tax=Esox lucius TaxID=8010 RepID=A0AAY5KVW2_ESOLU
MGEQRPRQDVGKQRPRQDVGKQRPRQDVGKQRPRQDVGKQRPRQDVGKPRPRQDVGKPRPRQDVGKQRPRQDVGKPRPSQDVVKPRPSQDEGKQRPRQAGLRVELLSPGPVRRRCIKRDRAGGGPLVLLQSSRHCIAPPPLSHIHTDLALPSGPRITLSRASCPTRKRLLWMSWKRCGPVLSQVSSHLSSVFVIGVVGGGGGVNCCGGLFTQPGVSTVFLCPEPAQSAA